jgi:hypothetical protein
MKDGVYAFGGITPAVEEYLLNPAAATVATDVDVRTGKLKAVRNDAVVGAPTKLGTQVSMYLYAGMFWFTWGNDTDASTGTTADNVTDRVYFTEKGQPPRATDNALATISSDYPAASYLLGLPSPSAVSISTSGTANPDATQQATTAVVTYVTNWGEEGPPSVASNIIEYVAGQSITVNGIPGPPSGAYNIAFVRIYVAVYTTSGVGAFKFWKTVPIGTSTITGGLAVDALGEAVQSPYLLAPPTDLFGIMSHPGKFMIGFSKNRMYRSEINRPYGWPDAYVDPFPDPIVGGKVIGSAVVVCTTKGTYWCEGSDPATFSVRKLDSLQQPCVAKRSIVSTDQGVAYASADGLVLIAPDASWVVVTREAFLPEQWATYNPSSFTATYLDGQYIAAFDTGLRRGSIVIDLARQRITESAMFFTAAAANPELGAVHMISDGNIVMWRSGVGTRPYVWRGKVHELPFNQKFGRARVIAETYPVTLKLIQDGQTTNTVVIPSRNSVALHQVRGDTVQFELTGGDNVRLVEVALTAEELRKAAQQ